jgi:hypothetical protein
MRRSGSVAYTECSVSFLGGSAGYLPYAGRGAWWVETLRTTDLVFDWEAPEARKEIARGVSPGFWVQPLSQAPEGRQVDAKPAVSFPEFMDGPRASLHPHRVVLNLTVRV